MALNSCFNLWTYCMWGQSSLKQARKHVHALYCDSQIFLWLGKLWSILEYLVISGVSWHQPAYICVEHLPTFPSYGFDPSLKERFRRKSVSVRSLKISPNIKRNYPLFCFQGRDKTQCMTQWGDLKQLVKNQEGSGSKTAWWTTGHSVLYCEPEACHTPVISLCMPHFLWASYCSYKFLRFPSIFGKWD